MDEKIKIAYEEYLKLPKGGNTIENLTSELYNNQWCFLTGLSVMEPHPHRHYTLLEFAYNCGIDKTLRQRFLK